MAVQLLKCKYCGASFNRETEPHIKIQNRYAHQKCYEEHQKQTSALRQLTDYIKELYAPYEPDWKMITAQIQRYKNEGMTYYGMYYTLEFFFVVKKNKVDPKVGIGIIPYMYKRAQEYYTNTNSTLAKAAQIAASPDKMMEQKSETIIIENTKPQKKLIEFEY